MGAGATALNHHSPTTPMCTFQRECVRVGEKIAFPEVAQAAWETFPTLTLSSVCLLKLEQPLTWPSLASPDWWRAQVCAQSAPHQNFFSSTTFIRAAAHVQKSLFFGTFGAVLQLMLTFDICPVTKSIKCSAHSSAKVNDFRSSGCQSRCQQMSPPK